MKHVWSITVVLIILSILSLFNILSFSISPEGDFIYTDMFSKQLLFIFIGWLVYVVFSRIHYSIFKYPQLNIILYIFTLLLLISTLIWGPVINNTQRWLFLFGDFQFQPSELAKITLILFTASIFYLRNRLNDVLVVIISLLLLLPILSIVYIQPHGSMSIILLVLWFSIIMVSIPNQIRNVLLISIFFFSFISVLMLTLKLFFYFAVCLIILIVLSVFTFYGRDYLRKALLVFLLIGFFLGLLGSLTWNSLLLDYQKDRVIAFFEPIETSQDLGFNVDQSRIAIGSGGIFGKGWGFGTQSKLRFLPEYHTDFVFASFSEEFGFVGSVTLLLLYSYLIFRILIFSFHYYSFNFEFVILIGIAIKIFLEVFINIGTNTGIIPATGIPLPIMSYGGSNIILTFFSLALVQSIIGNTFSKINEEKLISFDNN